MRPALLRQKEAGRRAFGHRLRAGGLASVALLGCWLGLVPRPSSALHGRRLEALETPGQRRAIEMLSPLSVVEQPHGGGFVVGSDGRSFQVRGFNYLPLARVRVDGRPGYRNDTFAPSRYRHVQVARTLARMEARGYTTVRVLLNPHEIGNERDPGLDGRYVGDLVDFLATAARHDLRTLLTVGELPTAGGYLPPSDPRYGGVNQDYLDPAYLAARQRYLEDLIHALEARHAPLVDVLFELKSEQRWDNSAAPLDWRSGVVGTLDGKRYDMAKVGARAAMEDENLLAWANRLSATVHALVPGSLVGVGFYPPSVRRPEWTVRPQVLFGATARNDFVDVHVYPNLGPEQVQLASFGAGDTSKPVVMGEFGATRAGGTLEAASSSLIRWQERSCSLGGLSIAGWLLWTWDSRAQSTFWNALDGGGRIAHALAPAHRPNPCT